MNTATVMTLPIPAPTLKQVCRYLRTPSPSAEVIALVKEATQQLPQIARGRLCCLTLPCTATKDTVRLGEIVLKSTSLARRLADSDNAVLFAATLGIGVDRAIRQASLRSCAYALALDAAATAAIEALCDRFCTQYKQKSTCTRRFSPGYGDLPLGFQHTLLDRLNAHRNIGLALSNACLMIPTKSVTAIFGIRDTIEKSKL